TNVIRTKNYLCDLDPDSFAVTTAREVQDESGWPDNGGRIKGFEDCRLFENGGYLFCSGVVCDKSPGEPRQYFLASLSNAGDINRLRVNTTYEAGRVQKNWMPAPSDDVLRFVYSCGPTVILDWEGEQPNELVRHDTGENDLS